MLLVVISLIIGGLIGGMLMRVIASESNQSDKITPAVVADLPSSPVQCTKYKCNLVKTEALIQILGETSAKGSGGIIGSDPTIKVQIKNPDNQQMVTAKTEITCWKTSLGDKRERLSLEPTNLKPGEVITLTTKFEIDAGEDWECNNYQVSGSGLNKCELVEIKS